MRSLFYCSLVFLPLASAQLLTPVWTELGGQGTLARVVVRDAASCPGINVDGVEMRMSVRQPIPAGFPPVCEALLPVAARSASAAGQTIALPRAMPDRIVILGDTGCRIKGEFVQACNDAKQWPFAKVADRAARESPSLVMHVGDYLYREQSCPPASTGCTGSPWGDNWQTWDADFFTPVRNLLVAAPWVFARGNHEDCERSWRGWFYYLDPGPARAECVAMTNSYFAMNGPLRLLVVDSASSSEDLVREQARQYSADLKRALAGSSGHVWIVDHHPFWGLRAGDPALQLSSSTMRRAAKDTDLDSVDLIISGHIHLFQLNQIRHRPLQIVAGNGGTQLADPLPAGKQSAEGIHVVRSATQVFGYSVLLAKPDGSWDLTAEDADGRPLAQCMIQGRKARCP